MRETLIGITTITLLFGIVWLSQNKANANKNIAYKKQETSINKSYNTDTNKVKENKIKMDYSEELNTDTANPCELCNTGKNMNDNFTFSEAFKLCRECLGNEGVFVWNGNSYSTKIKETKPNIDVDINQNNLVVKEGIISPPPEDNKDIVSSN